MGNQLKKAIMGVATFVAVTAVFSRGYFIPLTSATASEETSSVVIDETNFPDETFRGYVSENFDSDADGVLSEEEIDNVTNISVEKKYISDLTGIEKFTSLTYLDCSENNLTSLDVSQNTALTEIFCCRNKLASLDVSHNTELIDLYCYTNKITSLDVSKNIALTVLECEGNQLTSLDVNQNTELTYLDCSKNQLTSLDVRQNTALTYLDCYENNLTSLDVRQNTSLKYLGCSLNQITSLDVSKNTALTGLDCGDNNLTSLDVSGLSSLTHLSASGNSYDVGTMNCSKEITFAFPEGFDNTRTSNWDTAIYDSENNRLKVIKLSNDVVDSNGNYKYHINYSYDVGNGNNVNFQLSFSYEEAHDYSLEIVDEKYLKSVATCLNNAIYYKSCSICGEKDEGESFEAENSSIEHTLSKVAAHAATCTVSGNSEYWICSMCGKYFSDEKGEEEIPRDNVITKKLGHNLTKIDAKEATCTADGNTEYWICRKCRTYFSDENGKKSTTLGATIIKGDHKLTKIDAKEATSLTDGNTEYWTCSVCEKYFSDENGEKEITLDDVTIKADHKLSKVDAKAATCTEDGNTEYWTCSECGKYFSDENGEKETTLDDTVISRTNHSYINYVSNNDEKAATCTTAGQKASKTAVCENGCGTTDTIKGEVIAKLDHKYKKVVTQATTKKNGSIIQKCSVCDNVKSKKEIAYVKSATLSATAYTYTGKAIKPTVTVKDSKGNKLTTASYTVNYVNNTKVGKATVKITLKGNYSGTITKTFKINPKATSISALTATSKGFKVTWKKQATQTTGYQIRYSTKASMSGAKTVTVKKNSTTKTTVTKLTAKKKYYVQIRTYTKVNGVVYYSAWSKAKAVTTRK
jgi:hypothetical protein